MTPTVEGLTVKDVEDTLAKNENRSFSWRNEAAHGDEIEGIITFSELKALLDPNKAKEENRAVLHNDIMGATFLGFAQ